MNSLAQIADETLQKYKKFKIKRNPENCALVLEISKNQIVVEEEYEQTPLEELQEYLPHYVQALLLIV